MPDKDLAENLYSSKTIILKKKQYHKHEYLDDSLNGNVKLGTPEAMEPVSSLLYP